MANKGFNYEIRLTAKDDYSGAISGVRAGLKKTQDSVLDISVDLKKLGSTFDDVASDMIGKAGGVNDALKKVGQDGGLGKAGEGASKAIPQFNNLNFSVQQIVRELPSATMGANMFFLAISNNLPILADNIKRVKEENLALAKSGQTGVPVWKQVTSSLLSWQTVMIVGITLLTTYGSEIVNVISELFSTKKATDSSKQAAESLNEAMKKGADEAQKEVIHLQVLYNASQDHARSLKDRKIAISELKNEYPSYFKNISDEVILAGNAKTAYDDLATSLVKVAQARAIEDKLVENSKKALEIESDLKDKEQKYNETRVKLAKALKDGISGGPMTGGSWQAGNIAALKAYIIDYENAKTEAISLRKENEKLANSIEVPSLVSNPKGTKGVGKAAEVNTDLNTIGGIENKIKSLEDLQSKSSGKRAAALEKEIQLWKDKLNVMQFAISIGSNENNPASALSQGKSYVDPVASISQLEAKKQSLLKDFSTSTDVIMMREINNQVKAIEDRINRLKSLGAGGTGLTDTTDLTKITEQNDRNWKLPIAKKDIDVTNEYADSLTAIASVMGNISQAAKEGAAAWLTWGANLLSAIASAIPQIAALTTAKQAEATANSAAATTGAAASVASIPIVGWIMAVAAAGAVVAAMLTAPKFAQGGLAYGPTFGLFGEYSGASNNPEVVAPLNKLKSLLQPQASVSDLSLETKVRGKDLYVVLQAEQHRRSRTR